MPGALSIYYGSEWGLTGARSKFSDRAVRPTLEITRARRNSPTPDLERAIALLRRQSIALHHGDYRQLFVSHKQFAFARFTAQEYLVVMLNAADGPAQIEVSVPVNAASAIDLLNPGEQFAVKRGRLCIEQVYPC